ncbi:MAG: hypothetical protein ACFKPT_03600 [Gloeotrichia echinulata GP01]
MQQQLQKTDFVSQSNNQQQIQKLNNLDSQVWLYMGVLERLGANTTESNERIAKTIEALKSKKSEILDELNPRRPEKYRKLAKILNFFESITLNKEQKDFIQIEKIIDEVVFAVRSSQPSATIIQESLNKLSRETTRKADKISPYRLRIMYKIGGLINEISLRQLSNFDDSELANPNESIINELKEPRNLLSQQFKKLLQEKYEMQQELQRYSEALNNLNRLISERETELSRLREELEKYISANLNRQNQISNLNTELNRIKQTIFKFQNQEDSLNRRVNELSQDIREKQSHIEKLTKQLDNYSNVRLLKGEYIGNVSDQNSKYHFNRKCNHWKMLVGEYVLNLDGSREIISSSTDTVFISKGLKKCSKC